MVGTSHLDDPQAAWEESKLPSSSTAGANSIQVLMQKIENIWR